MVYAELYFCLVLGSPRGRHKNVVGCLTVSDSPLSDSDNRLHIKDEHGHSSSSHRHSSHVAFGDSSRGHSSGRSQGTSGESSYQPMITSPPDLISDTLAKVKHSLSSSNQATDQHLHPDSNANIPKQEVMTCSNSSSASSSSSSRRSGRSPKMAPLLVDTSLGLSSQKLSQISPTLLQCQKSERNQYPPMMNLNALPASHPQQQQQPNVNNNVVSSTTSSSGHKHRSSGTSRHNHHHHHHYYHQSNNQQHHSPTSQTVPHSQGAAQSQLATSYPTSTQQMESHRSD